MKHEIKKMVCEDWKQVRNIYREGIETGNATFETKIPGWNKWNSCHIASGSLVARSGSTVLGFAALSSVSDRCVYTGVAEVSIYIGKKYQGQGVGTKLLEHLISLSEKNGFWTLQAGIFPENAVSLALHKKLGFRVVGRREKIGRMKDGTWRDVILLERRSKQIGMD